MAIDLVKKTQNKSSRENMRNINPRHTIHKEKLGVLALALSGALATMVSLHAQTITGTITQATLTNTDLTISGTALISGSNTGIKSSGSSLGTLSNSGIVTGLLYGVSITYGSNLPVLINNTGATISSTATSARGIFNRGIIGTLSNAGLISGSSFGLDNSSGTITMFNNDGTIASSIAVVNQSSGVITSLNNNSGSTITGNSGGIYNNSTISTLNNDGYIHGNNRAIYNSGGLISRLTNNGLISGQLGIINDSGRINTLTNNNGGSIIGTNYGIGNAGNIGTLTNNGFISGGLAAIYLVSGSTLGYFTNTGTIAGTILNESSNILVINGSNGTIFGTLTGYSGGIAASDIGNIISTSNLSFGSGNQLLNDNITVNSGSGTVTNAGVLELINPVTITGNYLQKANASLLIGVTSGAIVNGNLTDIGYGRLVVNGNAIITSGSTITLTSLGYSLAQGQRYVVIAASGSGTNYNASNLIYSASGYIVTGTVQTDSSNSAYSDLVLTLGGTTPRNGATTSNAISALGGLFKYGGTDANLLAVFNPAAALATTASANQAGAKLSPAALSNATVQAVNTANQAVTNVVISHVDGLRLAQSGASGIATGERHADIALWGQIFGGHASQDLRDNVSGYHANYRGLLIGADGLVSDTVRAGGLISAAKTTLASDDDNTGSSADINNYGFTAYATYTGTPWYVHVTAGVSRQQYNTVRAISYTGFSGTTNGSFHGSQYLSSVQAGYPLQLNTWLPGATLTPIAGLSYSTLRQNGYTETGGNGAALAVNAATSNSLKSELGAKLESAFDIAYGKLLPSVQLGWRHEYRSDATQTAASFAADSTGSTAFVTQSSTPVANTAVLNLGLTLAQSNNLSLTGKYTLESGGGYTAQTGSVQVRWQY
jgi:outer membrane autotransporter protein